MGMALTASTNRKSETLRPQIVPLYRAVHCYKGSLICRNTAHGYGVKASAATTLVAVGIAMSEVDNTSGGDGNLAVEVESGDTYCFRNGASGTDFTDADIGSLAYTYDDDTVVKSSTGASVVGVVEDVDQRGVWVKVEVGGASLAIDAAARAAAASLAAGTTTLDTIIDSATRKAVSAVEKVSLSAIKDLAVTDLTFTPAFLTGKNDATAVVATWNAVTDGSFAITINGAAQTVTGLDFSTDTTMEGIAGRIQVAIQALTGAADICIWSTDHFLITSSSSANTSAVTVTRATGSGTDISGAGGTPFMSANEGNGAATARSLGTYTLVTTDHLVRVSATLTDAVRLIMPTLAVAGNGREYVILDVGTAGTNNITLVHSMAETINGVHADFVIGITGMSVTVKADSTATDWRATSSLGVTGKTGTGTTAVFSGSPTITTPTVAGVATITGISAVAETAGESTHKIAFLKIGETTYSVLVIAEVA